MSKRYLYFNEGPGFFAVKPLGSGCDGAVTLVRHQNQYFARKEHADMQSVNRVQDFAPSGKAIPRYQRRASREYTMAKFVQNVPGLYKTIGWAYHSDGRKLINVDYYKVYNLGSIPDLCYTGQQRRTPSTPSIPEYWVCKFLNDMLTTISQLHDNALVHNDAGSGNWLFDYHSPGHVSVHLCDFAVAQHYWEFANLEGWEKAIVADYTKLQWAFYDILSASGLLTTSQVLNKVHRKLGGLAGLGGCFTIANPWAAIADIEKQVKDHLASLEPVPWPRPPPASFGDELIDASDKNAIDSALYPRGGGRGCHYWSTAAMDNDGNAVDVRACQNEDGDPSMLEDPEIHESGDFEDLH